MNIRMENLLGLLINHFFMKKKISVLWIIICWFIVSFLLGLIKGSLADNKASGGEQKLFTYVAISIIVGLIGVALISILYLLFGNSRKNRSICICFLIIALVILMPIIYGTLFNRYDTLEKTRYRGSNRIDIKVEYYTYNASSDTIRHIRSEKFWNNGMKDSIWTIYERDGRIISQRIYKNDKLIRINK